MPDVTVTINGKEVQTSSNNTVIQAALDSGITVPYLCYHPGMKPFGACRMCLVQVEGGRGYPASCTLPVTQGMVVSTNSPEVEALRKTYMEMLIAEHPHGCLTCHRIDLCGPEDICLRHVSVNDRCVICPKNERCELKDTVRFMTMELESPLVYKNRELPVAIEDPFYDRDYNLCIVCGRCVRACEELRGDNAITFVDRAGKALVGTSTGSSLLESGCEFCGACLDVCPVGALVEREHKWDKPVKTVRTVCGHCSVGCQLNLEVDKRDRVIRSIPELNAPANRGQACFKGKFGLEFVNSKSRLKHPMIRRNGTLEVATWEEAIKAISEGLGHYKGDRFAAIASATGTNEDNYLLQKFARVGMGSNNVDHASNIRPELVHGLGSIVDYQAGTNTIWELEKSKCILTVSTNTTEEHNVLAIPIKKAAKGGATIIVIDPREVELTRYAKLWLRNRPGTESVLLGGILRAIFDLALENKEFLDERCNNLEALKTSLVEFSVEKVAKETGVPEHQILEAARLYSEGPSSIVYALDNVPQAEHSSCVHAIADLALVTGNIGKSSSGIYPLRLGANEQGSWDVGCVPYLLAGYKSINDDDARSELEAAYGSKLPETRGLGLREMFEGARQGSIKAMLIMGDNANFSNNELGDVDLALGKLEFLVVQDVFLSLAAQRADVVLPASTFVEKSGTYTNLERRVQLLSRVISPKSIEAMPDWWTISSVATYMGVTGFDFADTAQIMDEIAHVAPIYSGISHQRLIREAVLTLRPDPQDPQPTQMLYSDRVSGGLQWPCYGSGTPGTPILYEEGFSKGKATLAPIKFSKPHTHNDPQHPLLLAFGRVLAQPDRAAEVTNASGMNLINREERVEISSADAVTLEISEGESVEIVSTVERLRATAHINGQAHVGVVYMTTLFGELASRLDASKEPDSMYKVPGLPVTPVRIEKLIQAKV